MQSSALSLVSYKADSKVQEVQEDILDPSQRMELSLQKNIACLGKLPACMLPLGPGSRDENSLEGNNNARGRKEASQATAAVSKNAFPFFAVSTVSRDSSVSSSTARNPNFVPSKRLTINSFFIGASLKCWLQGRAEGPCPECYFQSWHCCLAPITAHTSTASKCKARQPNRS